MTADLKLPRSTASFVVSWRAQKYSYDPLVPKKFFLLVLVLLGKRFILSI